MELTVNLSEYPKLDDKQAGHIRHFHNLVAQPDGDWHYFGTADAHEEFDDARRYQLATMAYAAGSAHYHRLPALRGVFRTLIRRMIHKMLLREVWSYWFTSSHGGKVFDPDFNKLRVPWADPVIKENIMYSGHLLLMTSLYAMLFDDDEFERKGSIVFDWNPLFWGLGREKFVYDNRSLATVIVDQMRENDWVGVCCEPNAIFVVCNQFPIVALRYNDSRDNTAIVTTEILPKYLPALKRKGMLSNDSLYASFYAVKQKKTVPARHGAHTAWANAFMNAWYPEHVQASYRRQSLGFLTHIGGKTRLNPTVVALPFRSLVFDENHDPKEQATLDKAREMSKDVKLNIPFETLNWLGFTMMLSELGQEQELQDLLDYADDHLNPTWVDGGLYYPRNQQLMDKDGNLTHMEPHSGNSGIGYSRLNVKDGQKKMWEAPWQRTELSQRPYVDGDCLKDDLDFLRGTWDADRAAMILTVRRWHGASRPATLHFENLPIGSYGVFVNGKYKKMEEVTHQNGRIIVVENVGMEEIDIIVQRA